MTTAAASPTRIPLAIEITSDSICPFCFIGYRRISKAIEQAKAEQLPIDFSVEFAPFLLDPTLPEWPATQNKRERYIAKFGGAEKVKAMEDAMIERGRGEGIEFTYDGTLSQTTSSHRLILKAKQVGGEEAQRKMVEKLFNSYFEKSRDPGDHDVLSTNAEEAGVMSKAEALEFLKGDELKSEVKQGIVKAQMRGISGVPFSILNGKLAISGAQEIETFLDVFRRVASGELKA